MHKNKLIISMLFTILFTVISVLPQEVNAQEQTTTVVEEFNNVVESEYDSIDIMLLNALKDASNQVVIDTTGTQLTMQGLFDRINRIVKEQPEIFYYKGIRARQMGNQITLTFNYTNPRDEIIIKKNELESKVQQIIQAVIKDDMSDYEKELALHDYLVLNAAYDYKNYLNGSLPDDSYNAYGLLIKGTGVCEAYAESMKILLDRVGVECTIVTGMMLNGGGHAWNMVKIDNAYYHLDVTHDDPVPNRPGEVMYTYFNVTDDFMSKSRVWDNLQTIKCTAKEANYYFKEGLLVQNKEALEQKIKTDMESNQKQITIKFEDYNASIKDISSILRKNGYYKGFSYSISNGDIWVIYLK